MSTEFPQTNFQPLNPKLYQALRYRFQSVEVADEGSEMQTLTLPDPLRPGKDRMEVISAGEYYRICCPYCGDCRHRLWINHQFCQIGPDGWPQLWLAHCYNEQCLDSFERRKDLEELIFGFRNFDERTRPMQIGRGKVAPQSPGHVQLPGEVIRVDRLEPNHPAAVYLRDKRYHDLQSLGHNYHVSYCHDAHPDYRNVQGRIIIPIFQNSLLVGWQARHIGEIDWKATGIPKYFTCPGMKKSQLLYNLDVAKNWPFAVVVEGVTSVWRIGGPAVALLGKTLSSGQQKLLYDHWTGKPVFLMLDADAKDNMEGMAAEIRRIGKITVIPIELQPGSDPDNYDHATIVNFICGSARQHGFTLQPW